MNTIIKINLKSSDIASLINSIENCSHATAIYSNLDVNPTWEDIFTKKNQDKYPFTEDCIVQDIFCPSDEHNSYVQDAINRLTTDYKFEFVYLFNHFHKK